MVRSYPHSWEIWSQISFQHFVKRVPSTPSTLFSARSADTNNDIEAFFDPNALPTPWPLGLLSILISLATGISQYKLVLPEQTWHTKVGWSITFVRSVSLGISAVISLLNHKHGGVSSDGFLALFANVVGLMSAHHDYGELWWARAGVIAMVLGIFPRLGLIAFGLWEPHNENTFAPFRWSDGTQCIIDRSSSCNLSHTQYNIPYCTIPVLGRQGILTFVDVLRLVACLFAAAFCMVGLERLLRKEKAQIFSRRAQVIMAYVALIFSVALILASAIVFSRGLRERGLDCREVTSCVKSQPLPCPSIIVFTPRSSNGFFRAWAEQFVAKDIPSILI
jgi:hypothetical protein